MQRLSNSVYGIKMILQIRTNINCKCNKGVLTEMRSGKCMNAKIVWFNGYGNCTIFTPLHFQTPKSFLNPSSRTTIPGACLSSTRGFRF
jgi:hypothetical protein